jgi:hypothetical protein
MREDPNEPRLRRIGLNDPPPAVQIEIGRIEADSGPPQADNREGGEHDAQDTRTTTGWLAR